MLNHIACIMDGNRRWAQKRNLRLWEGHQQGVQAVRTTTMFCLKEKIQHLSFYTFSIENFKRTQAEQRDIFSCIADALKIELPFFLEKRIRVRFIGDRTLFPEFIVPLCEQIEQETAKGKVLTVYFLLCYGARQELIAAAKKIAEAEVDYSTLTTKKLKDYLWTGQISDPDIIIRTGGVKRLSNFLLYQAAYSELCFLDCLWPDLSEHDLHNVITEFKKSKRTFGR